MPQPLKLTAETERLICRVLRGGNTVEVAVAVAGVSRSTFFGWMERGRRETSGPFAHFRAEVEQARAEAEGALLTRIREDWRAACWVLEHNWPQRWAKPKDRWRLRSAWR